MHCPLPVPASVPKHATHLGLGICQDENDASIPCSVYEHAPVRQRQTYRYLVLFHPGDRGSELVHQMPVRDNPNAMVAELAYQLGLSLLETSCCSEQASAYRAGYLDALELLAVSAWEGSDL